MKSAAILANWCSRDVHASKHGVQMPGAVCFVYLRIGWVSEWLTLEKGKFLTPVFSVDCFLSQQQVIRMGAASYQDEKDR